MARPRKNETVDTTPQSQTLDRGLRLLAAVAESPEPVDVAQLAALLDVHRSVAYRLVRTLEQHSLVELSANGRYQPGIGLSALASSVRRPLQAAAMPELTRLASRAGATAFVAVRHGDEAVTIASVEPPHVAAHVAYRPGTRHAVDRGAPGLAILAGGAALPAERPEVELARQRGFAHSRGEVLAGLSSVAAPIVRGSGDVAGAVALVFVPDDPDIAALGSMVAESATAIVHALGD